MRAAPTSIDLISASVLVSNIETGVLLEKPWPDLGSTATPWPPVFGISPTGSIVSRLNTVIAPGHRGLRRRRVGRGDGTRPAARNVEASARDVGVDVVRSALATNARGFEHLIRTVGRRLLRTKRGGQRRERDRGDQSDVFHARKLTARIADCQIGQRVLSKPDRHDMFRACEAVRPSNRRRAP